MFVAREKIKQYLVGNSPKGNEVYAAPSVLAKFGKAELKRFAEDCDMLVREIDDNTCTFNLVDKTGSLIALEMFSAVVEDKELIFVIAEHQH